MAKKPRTPEEQRRIDERIAFVQANPDLAPEEARTRYYVQTRAAELEAQGKTVDRKALRQKFQTGGVTRVGFYTPGDIQAGARRRAALNATRTGETGTGSTGNPPATGVTAPETGPLGDNAMIRGVSTRIGPGTQSLVPTPTKLAATKEPEKITPWQESWPNKQIAGAIDKIDRAATKVVKGAHNIAYQSAESMAATFTNPLVNEVGRLFGQNPNLRVAGPMEAATNTVLTIADIFTAGASRAATTGLRASTPGITRTIGALVGETAARTTVRGAGIAGISGRAVGGQIASGGSRIASQVGQRVVDRIPGGQKIKAVASKIDEMVTPFQYRQLREGVATVKPPKAGGRSHTWQGTRTDRIRATEQIDAEDILDFEPEDVTDLFGPGRVGNVVNEAGDDAFTRTGFDIEETVEAPRYSADVTTEELEEAADISDWMRDAPKPTASRWGDETLPPAQTTPPPAQTTQVIPEARAPRAPEPQTQRTTPPPAQTTPPPTAPPAASSRPVLQLGPDRPEPTTEVGRSLKALFQDVSEGIQEATAQIPTPTPRPPAAAAPEGDLGSLFGPEFQARRQAADDAARRAAERSPNSRAARQNPELRTPTRRADLTPEELEARKVESRAKDAERKRLDRAKKAEERKAAKEAAQKAADEAAQQAPTTGVTEALSETEQARAAAGQSNPSWFTAKRERQAQRAAEAASAPAPQTAQEVVVSAREAVTEATQIPESQMTSSVLPEAPSASVRSTPVEPTRPSDTTTRGTGRQKPAAEAPAPPKVPEPTASTTSSGGRIMVYKGQEIEIPFGTPALHPLEARAGISPAKATGRAPTSEAIAEAAAESAARAEAIMAEGAARAQAAASNTARNTGTGRAPVAPASATAGKPMDLSAIKTQERFDEFMNKQGGRQLLNDMPIQDFVATVKANPNIQAFLEKNPVKQAATSSGTKVPGQMKAVSNEGTQTRFNRRGVTIPEELSSPMTFEPPVKPTSTAERTALDKTIGALENQRTRLMELTDLRGGARTEVESANIAALERQIEESRRVMLEFNQEYIASVVPKARPMSATENARLARMAKQKAAGKPVSETVDESLPGLSSDVESELQAVESRGTQRRTSDPDFEQEVNPDDIDLFDEPSY